MPLGHFAWAIQLPISLDQGLLYHIFAVNQGARRPRTIATKTRAEDPCHSNRIFSFFTYSISAVAKLRDHISGRELELLQQRGVSRIIVQALQ